MVMTVKPVVVSGIKISRVMGSAPVSVKPVIQKETSVKVFFNGPPGRRGDTTASAWATAEW